MNPPALGYPPSRPQQRSDSHVLSVRQEPESARVIVRGKEKDRKPIDPPPVIQMRVYDEYNATCSYLHNPYYFCVASLWDPEEDSAYRDDDPLSPEPLAGQLVSSLHRLKDYDNTEQGFFVFGDLSAAVMGRFRLHFAVYEYRPISRHGDVQFLKSINSRVFEVSSPKDWEGVRESTALSRSFADQGVRLRLRKESRNSSSKRAFSQQTVQSVSQTPLRPLPVGQSNYPPFSGQEPEPSFKRQRSFPTNAPPPGYPPSSQGWQPGAFAPVPGQPGTFPQVGPGPYDTQYASGGGQYGGSSQAPYSSYGAPATRPPQGGESSSFMSPLTSPPAQMQPPPYRPQSQGQPQQPRSTSTYSQSSGGYGTPSSGVYSNASYGGSSTSYSTSGYNYPPPGQVSSAQSPYPTYNSQPGGQQPPGYQYSNPSTQTQYGMNSATASEYRSQPSGSSSSQTSPRPGELMQPDSMSNPAGTPRLNPIQRFEAQVAERPAPTSDPEQPNQQSPYHMDRPSVTSGQY